MSYIAITFTARGENIVIGDVVMINPEGISD